MPCNYSSGPQESKIAGLEGKRISVLHIPSVWTLTFILSLQHYGQKQWINGRYKLQQNWN